MITQFKIFENQNEPEVGDYIICVCNDDNDFDLFISQNIGKLIEIKTIGQYAYPYIIKY